MLFVVSTWCKVESNKKEADNNFDNYDKNWICSTSPVPLLSIHLRVCLRVPLNVHV